MSTIQPDIYPWLHETEGRNSLRRFIFNWGSEPSLFGQQQLAARLIALDELDAIIGGLEIEAFMGRGHQRLSSRAKAFRAQLETANEELYATARAEIVIERNSRTLCQWLSDPASARESGSPCSGLGFDLRDEIVSGVLRLREPAEPNEPHFPEMVPYQPTPVRHILDLILASELSGEDVLVDLGSGLGHVPLLVSIMRGIRTLGIEIQPGYVESARQCAQGLHLEHAQFLLMDAREADLSNGTVFYLFSPFIGSILDDVLSRLCKESSSRQIRVCSLGPCTRILQEQAWLAPVTQPNTEKITVFYSR